MNLCVVSLIMQKNNIVFIISPGAIGGAERYTEDLVNGLQKKGYAVQILISHNTKYAKEISVKFPLVTHFIGNNLWKIFLNKSGIKYINKNSTIISNGYHSLFLSLLLRIWMPFKDIKHIDIKHGWVKNNRFQKILTSLDKVFSIFCNIIVVVNSEMILELKICAPKVIHIKTGIKQPINEIEIISEQEQIRLGMVGRIEPEKRFDLGLQVANKVAEKYPTELHIIGDGSLKNELIKNKYHKNLKQIFYGHVDREQVPYNNFDILLITSITEGSPLVALESMFLGKYIIATNVGNLTELLSNKRGALIQDSNTEKLINKMSEAVISYNKLDINQKIKIADYIQQYVNQNHSIDSMINDYMKIL